MVQVLSCFSGMPRSMKEMYDEGLWPWSSQPPKGLMLLMDT